MPKFLFFLLFSVFIFSGCTALKSGDSFEEGSYDTEEASEFTDSEEDEYADEEDEYADDEEEYAEGEGEEEELEGEETAEQKGGISGFFSRLFGGSDEEDEYEDYDEEFEGENEEDEGEDYADYSEEGMEDESYPDASEEDVGIEDISQEGNSIQIVEAVDTTGQAAEDNVSTTTETADPEPEPEKPSVIPLNKIIKTAYQKSDYLVNAVYIARENETLQSISQKIYNSDKTPELYVINPHLQSRTVKVGDKIYYNSPLRPNDNTRLLFYYEDVNAPSSLYMLSPGDNIRNVSSKLLGHPNSWKEIWATNPELESKGEISKSLNIVYWPKEAVAQAVPEPPAPVPEPSPSDDLAVEETVEDVDPPVVDEPQFPQPPKSKPKKSQPGLLQVILEQKEIFLGLVGVIIILILMIRLILRKRKQRDFDYTATNIEV